MKIYELLASPDKWTKGAFARDKEGLITAVKSDGAVCWCLSGAIIKCYSTSDDQKDVYERLISKTDSDAVCVWNDQPSRTFDEVLALVKELDV